MTGINDKICLWQENNSKIKGCLLPPAEIKKQSVSYANCPEGKSVAAAAAAAAVVVAAANADQIALRPICPVNSLFEPIHD